MKSFVVNFGIKKASTPAQPEEPEAAEPSEGETEDEEPQDDKPEN